MFDDDDVGDKVGGVNTINLIIINTHTRPWCHHNRSIDIDRAELPLNGVSTEVSRNPYITNATAQLDSHRYRDNSCRTVR